MYQANYRIEYLYKVNAERPDEVTVFVYFNGQNIGQHTGPRDKCTEFAFHLLGRAK